MTHFYHSPLPPCIVDVGTLINKRDMARLLADLGRVRYFDIVDHYVRREGEGYVMEVFEDPLAATLVANRALYLNVSSFDCLTLETHANAEGMQVTLDLVQEARILRLIPLSDPTADRIRILEESRALQAAMTDAANLGWESLRADEEDPRYYDR